MVSSSSLIKRTGSIGGNSGVSCMFIMLQQAIASLCERTYLQNKALKIIKNLKNDGAVVSGFTYLNQSMTDISAL